MDVEGLQSAANYVFYFEGGTPMLRIQGVRYSSNNAAVPSGPYDLSQNDPGLPSGISLICNWSAQNDHCGKSATPGTGWQFTGIKNFPVGVAWFQGNVTFNGLTNDSGPLITTLLATGDITLTNSGNDRAFNRPQPLHTASGLRRHGLSRKPLRQIRDALSFHHLGRQWNHTHRQPHRQHRHCYRAQSPGTGLDYQWQHHSRRRDPNRRQHHYH